MSFYHREFISVSFQDFQNQLYESYSLNFISAISRQKLEDIALAAIQTNAVTQVSKVICYSGAKCIMCTLCVKGWHQKSKLIFKFCC